jgi:uncharacterized membrane protein YfcA
VATYFLFFVATIVAGAINFLGGGGGLITFTLLALVLPPVTADATSTLALLAGYPTAVWGPSARSGAVAPPRAATAIAAVPRMPADVSIRGLPAQR